MNVITVKSQRELDALPVDYCGRIFIEFGTPYNRAVVNRKFQYAFVVARENSSVVAWGNSSVVARENSSVVAWENSSVVAWGNSSVVALENSSVVAWENSSVEARENSSVVARGNSSVEAWENSSVVAWENSSVVAKHNSQVNDKTRSHKITTSGNARIVYDPQDIQSYMDTYELDHDEKTVRLFKAVHKREGRYMADWTDFEYKVGEVAVADKLTTDVNEDCGHGIHMAHKGWCLSYGADWSDLAILEMEAKISGVIVPLGGAGKVRAAQAKVLREVPLEECGLYGKMLAGRRNSQWQTTV